MGTSWWPTRLYRRAAAGVTCIVVLATATAACDSSSGRPDRQPLALKGDGQVRVAEPTSNVVEAGRLRLRIQTSGVVRDLHVSFDGHDVTRQLDGGKATMGGKSFAVGEHNLWIGWKDSKGKLRSTAKRVTAAKRRPELLKVQSARADRSGGAVTVAAHVRRPDVGDVIAQVNGRQLHPEVSERRSGDVQLTLRPSDGVRSGKNKITIVAVGRDRKAFAARDVDVTVKPLSTGDMAIGAAAGGESPQPNAHVPLGGAWIDTMATTGGCGSPVNDPSSCNVAIKVGDASYPTPVVIDPAQEIFATAPYILVLDARTLQPLNVEPGGTVPRIAPAAKYGAEFPKWSDVEVRNAARDAATLASTKAVPAIAIMTSLFDPAPNGSSLIPEPGSYVFAPRLDKPEYGFPVHLGATAIAADSSGWWHETSHSSYPKDAAFFETARVSGWLTRHYPGADHLEEDRFSLDAGPTVPFDTHASAGPGTNTMRVGSRTFTATLPKGKTDGFHVVILEHGDNEARSEAWASDDPTQIGQMAAALDALNGDAWGHTVLIQSIGRPHPSGANWNGLAVSLSHLVGGPDWTWDDVLLRLGDASPFGASDEHRGIYAFVGAAGGVPPGMRAVLQKDERAPGATSVEASTVNSIGDRPGTASAPGELAGTLAPLQSFLLAPTTTSWGGDARVGALQALAQAPPTPFPPLASDDERAALGTIANYSENGSRLDQLKGNSCYPPEGSPPPPDRLVRAAYCDPTAPWGSYAGELLPWADGSKPPPASYGGDPAAFRRVAAELRGEFLDLQRVHSMLDVLDGVITKVQDRFSADANSGVLKDLRTALPPPRGGSEVTYSALGMTGEALSLFGLLPGAEGLEVVGGIMEFAGHSLELADTAEPSSIESATVDPTQLEASVKTQLSEASAGIAAIRDRLAMDGGKLRRAADNAAGVNVTPDNPMSANWLSNGWNTDNIVDQIARGAAKYLATIYASSVFVVFTTPTLGKPRTENDVLNIACDTYVFDDQTGGRDTSWSPFPSKAYPLSAVYLPRDSDVPSSSWTLMYKEAWDPFRGSRVEPNPFSGGAGLFAPTQRALSILFDPPGSGGFGIGRSLFFVHRASDFRPAISADKLAAGGWSEPYKRTRCAWP